MKTIDYYFVSTSPWSYLGHERLGHIAAETGAQIHVKPFDLARVFPVSGGLPLPKRAPQRQAYRLVELRRWADFLGMPLNEQPRHFPVDHMPSMRLIAAARIVAGEQAAFLLASLVMRGCWSEERNVADDVELDLIMAAAGLDPDELRAAREAAEADIDRFTEEAIQLQVFGAPWYRIGDESFWGQDRLDFVERALREAN
ncbi:MAG: 2-hydroxychromene-2-carboxylate isomerase [Burkholderiaceae bacterium]